MHGLLIGQVTDVRLIYDPAQGHDRRPGALRGRAGADRRRRQPASSTPTGEAVEACCKRVCARRLQSASLITGQQMRGARFRARRAAGDGDEGRRRLRDCRPPRGGGFAGLQASATELLRQGQHHPVQADRRQSRRHPAVRRTISSNGPQLQAGADGPHRDARQRARTWCAAGQRPEPGDASSCRRSRPDCRRR